MTVVYLKTAYSKEILEKVANYFEDKNFTVELKEERTSYFYEIRLILSIYWEENKKRNFKWMMEAMEEMIAIIENM